MTTQIGSPVYTTVDKPGSKNHGQHIINWPATARAYEAQVKTLEGQLARYQDSEKVHTNRSAALHDQLREVHADYNALLSRVQVIADSWYSIFIPRKLRAGLRQRGVVI